MHFIRLKKFPPAPSLLSVAIIKECWILSNFFLIHCGFSHLLWSCDFILYSSGMLYDINFCVLNDICIPGVNSIWLWYMIF